MKILNMALSFGDVPDFTASERDFSKKDDAAPLSLESRKEFYSLLKSANYIAIDSDHLYKVANKSLDTNLLTQEIELTDPLLSDLPICPPFKCQWVELSPSSRNSLAPSINFNGYIITILGMLINETSPGVYNVYTFESHRKIDRDGGVHKFSLSRNVSGTNAGDSNLKMSFAVWMNAINNGSLCIETGEDVVMLPKKNGKKEGKKKPCQIKKIVRIIPKNIKQQVNPIMSKGIIDFSHRWEVRGHWRKVNGFGKDREGNYEIRGFTWISDCVKGPGDLPLVKKLRWVPCIQNNNLNFSGAN